MTWLREHATTLIVSAIAAATFLFCAAQSARVVTAMHERVSQCEEVAP